MLKLWTESPLKRVEPDDVVPAKRSAGRTLHMAGNSYESYQILLYGDEDFEITGVDFDISKDIVFRYNFQETIAFEKESFQDPLSNKETCQVYGGKIQSIWITAYAGRDTAAGSYEGKVLVTTSCGKLETELEVYVHSAVLPENSKAAFATEYWMHTVNFWFHFPNAGQMDLLNHYYGCQKYSDAWWEINRAIAQNMKENRINVLFVRTLDLLLDGGSWKDDRGKWNFCWELFDEWTAFFEEYADIKLFAGYHLVVQTEGKRIYLLDRIDGKTQVGMADIGSEKAEDWMAQFLTALYEHLGECGYRDRWLQHVEDEPGDAESWNYGREMVRKYMPGILCMDAVYIQGPTGGMQGQMDLWIPRVDTYECNREFYDYRLSQGEQRWTYNCNEPYYQNYMNKFLGWPLMHHRALPWACFTNHFNGFLHWGYNCWDPDDEWAGLNPKAQVKGDAYIIYPDEGTLQVKTSVRMMATRDGAQDFELLKLLADKDPAAAYEKSRKVAARFNDFNWDPQNLEDVRIEILEALDAE